MLWFVNHEWRKHGTCGKETPDSYFEQICALSAPIVAKVNELRAVGMDDYTYLDDIACQVDFMSDDIELFSHGRNTDGPEGRSNGEFMVSACLDPSGIWHLARSHHASRRRARGGSVTSASFLSAGPRRQVRGGVRRSVLQPALAAHSGGPGDGCEPFRGSRAHLRALDCCRLKLCLPSLNRRRRCAAGAVGVRGSYRVC